MSLINIKAWAVCLLAALFFSYELVQLHMLNAISPHLLKDLQINATGYALLSSTYLFADVVFLLPAGIILDHFSTRKVILSALFLCLVGTVGFGFSQTLEQACVCHFLSGIGNAFCFLSCIVLISKWFPVERHAFVIGVVVTVGMCGAVVAQTPFTLLAERFDWRNALLIDAFIGAILFVLIGLFIQDQPSGYIEKIGSKKTLPFFRGLKLSIFNLQNILCGCYTGLMNLPIMLLGAMWGSLFLTQIHHLELARASFVAGLICMGTLFGSPFFGQLSDRMGQRRILMFFGAVLSAMTMLVLIFASDLSFSVLSSLFFLLGFFSSTQVLGYPLITENNPKELTGTAMGVAAVLIMGLAAVAQPISGILVDLNWNGLHVDGIAQYAHGDYAQLFWMCLVGFLLSMLSVAFLRESHTRDYVSVN